MKILDIKTNARVIHEFYKGIKELTEIGSLLESNVAPYFIDILRYCSK